MFDPSIKVSVKFLIVNLFCIPVPGDGHYYAFIDVSSVGYIGPLDLQGDGLYDHNMYMEWILLANNANNLIMMNILYVDIERSPGCTKDFLWVRIIK